MKGFNLGVLVGVALIISASLSAIFNFGFLLEVLSLGLIAVIFTPFISFDKFFSFLVGIIVSCFFCLFLMKLSLHLMLNWWNAVPLNFF